MGEYEKRLFLGGPKCGEWLIVHKTDDVYRVPVMKQLTISDYIINEPGKILVPTAPCDEHTYQRMPMKLWPEAVPIMYHSSLIESGDQGQAFMRWLNALYHKAQEEG